MAHRIYEPPQDGHPQAEEISLEIIRGHRFRRWNSKFNAWEEVTGDLHVKEIFVKSPFNLHHPLKPFKRSIFDYAVLISIITLIALICAAQVSGGEPERIQQRIQRLTHYGTPDLNWVAQGGGSYLASFEGRTRCPRWVLEVIDRDQLTITVQRDTEGFKPDESIPVEFRVVGDDYRNSGFDRGHLAPAAVHRTSQRDLDSTFLYTNVVPQPHAVNSGIWLALENEIERLGESASVWVVTAPFWIAERGDLQIRTVGRRSIWVPTHVGKAALIEEDGGGLRMQAWIIPNTADRVAGKRLSDFEVSVDQFEIHAGLDLFNRLPIDDEIRLEGALP